MSLLGMAAEAASRGATSTCGAASIGGGAEPALDITGGASLDGPGSGGGGLAANMPTYSIVAAQRRARMSSAISLRLP